MNEISIDKEFVLRNYADLFKGLGTFAHEYDIKLKEDATPIAHAPRRVPDAIKSKLKMKLNDMVKNGIIEKANGYSPWVNYMVTVEKKDAQKSLRVCIDPKELNLNIENEHAYIPTFDDLASKLNGMKYFSVLDLKDGFWHVKLTPKSRQYCTFATPYGNYRFIRMPFGIKTGPSVFQNMNYENFGDIEGVLIYFDDIMIFARTRKEHDEILKKVLERAREKNVRFNENKIQIASEHVKYLGHIFSHNEIKPDPDRLVAIERIGRPKNKKDLQTFLGVVNYLRPFIPNLSELTAPLRELLKKNTIFLWTELHDKVIHEIKTLVLKSNILVPFDTKKDIIVQCDASQNGLGCCLLQNGKPISFASRSLSSAEQNYAQIEKEMLSIIFACTKFQFYTYGRKVHVVNDHKPLLGIMNKEIHKIASAKLQRMRLKLLNFDIFLEHAPGKSIQLADYLSRYMIQCDDSHEDKSLTESVLTINVSDERKNEIQKETEKDNTLKLIKNFCKNGWPNNKENCPDSARYFYTLRNDILLEDDILFYNERIIIPRSMRKQIIERLHEPHFGITKTLKRARSSVFWPNISNEIEHIVTHCRICQENANKNQKEPLIPHEIPNEPFKKVACDILEHKGKNFLAVVDFYSNWIELVKLKGKTAHEINIELLRIFSRFGYPHIIIADNVPFGSFECKEFAKKHDMKIITTSPRYAQANGMAERAVQICKNILKKSVSEEEMLQTLLAYRTTPIKNMYYSPAQLIQSRNLRNDLPMHENKLRPKLCVNVEQQHKNKLIKTKTDYDKSAKQRPDFEQNQNVLFQHNDKWQSGKIIKKHDTPRSYVIEKSDGGEYRRNTRHIRRLLLDSNQNKQNEMIQSTKVHQKVTRSGCRY